MVGSQNRSTWRLCASALIVDIPNTARTITLPTGRALIGYLPGILVGPSNGHRLKGTTFVPIRRRRIGSRGTLRCK